MKKTEEIKDGLELMIPVYLDTNALLDILASIEDGFAMVEKVTTRSSTADTTAKSVGTEFGIANILNLLKISIGASKTRMQNDEKEEERHSERYHTYGSLFHKLRLSLIEKGLLKSTIEQDKALSMVGLSDFVELRGIFHPNPLVEALTTIDRLVALILPLGIQIQQTEYQKGGKPSFRASSSQFESIRKGLMGIRSDLEQGDTRTFIVRLTDNSGYKVVVSLFTEYLRDRSMKELSYREFRLLGKVVRNIHEGDEAIDLLRGTGLGGITDKLLEQILAAFRQSEEAGIKLPVIETKIRAPVMEVIPIAIYA
jgi:hypothetical protein